MVGKEESHGLWTFSVICFMKVPDANLKATLSVDFWSYCKIFLRHIKQSQPNVYKSWEVSPKFFEDKKMTQIFMRLHDRLDLRIHCVINSCNILEESTCWQIQTQFLQLSTLVRKCWFTAKNTYLADMTIGLLCYAAKFKMKVEKRKCLHEISDCEINLQNSFLTN